MVAQGIRLTATGQAGCEVTGVLGYEPSPAPAGVILDLPDMHEHESKILATEIAHSALAAGEHELLKLNLEYADCLGDLDAVVVTVTVRLRVGDGPAELYQPNLDVVRVVELTRAAMTKDQVASVLDRGEYAKGVRMLKEQLDVLQGLQARGSEADPQVQAEIRELTDLIDRLDAAVSGPPPTIQEASTICKDLRWQSYQGRRGSRRS